jgi:hypothetical protein
MANPSTRKTLKEYCLRRLGFPVIEINIDEEQMEDRVDDALQFYRDWHYDGTERTYLKHQVTEADKTNEYLPVPSNINAITRIFSVGSGLQNNNLFNLRYQIHLNEVYDWSSSRIQNYVMSMERIALLDEVLTGKQPIRFSRHTDKLYIDMDWKEDVSIGEYIIVDCYRVLDPDVHGSVWDDWWLKRYTTALFKLQWGENLSKYVGMQLPGGLTFNGERLIQEARDEIEKLETEIRENYSLPPMDMIG